MGCASSKSEVLVNVGGEESSVPMKSPKKSFFGRKKTPSYTSDIGAEGDAFVAGLVQERSIAEMKKKYDTANAMEIGHGACGAVMAVKRIDTGDMFAMKIITLESMSAETFDELRMEIEVQRKLDHPNICKILEYYGDKRKGKMYIIMELCTGGALVSRMKHHRHGYGEAAAATLMDKMLSAIIYCHHHGIVHRDIKLDNMMYEGEAEDAELKLIDFGFACEVQAGRERMSDQLGTPSYMAPELWADQQYDSSVDVWALGVVAYMLMSGCRPFDHTNREEKMRMIREDPVEFPAKRGWGNRSEEAKDFCRQLMQKQPGDRLSATDALQHPFIKIGSSLHGTSAHAGPDAAHELEQHEEIVRSLEAFSHADGLAKLALQVIAFSTPPAKLDELRHVFQKMDEDGSGTLSLEEFKKAMALHPEVPQERVEQIFHDMDIAHHGEVDYNSFLAATVASSKQFQESENSILGAFNVLDTDHDGYIDSKDMERAFSGEISAKSAQRMLSNADSSGRVTFGEFKRSMVAMMMEADPDHLQATQSMMRRSNDSKKGKEVASSE